MAKKGQYPPGVKPRENAIQIKFKIAGEDAYCYETLRWTPSPANIVRAGQLRAEIVDKIRHGIFNYVDYFPDSPRAHMAHGTFAQIAQGWLDSPENDWAASSREKFKGILNRVWMPHLHNRQVAVISRAMISEALTQYTGKFKAEHGREPSKSLFNDWLLCVRGVFGYGAKIGAIKRSADPTQDLENKTRDKREPDPFTVDEANLIIEHAYRDYGKKWGAWFELGFYSGMRFPGEPSALTWDDVNMDAGEIAVSKTYTKAGVQERTKTGKARTVLLNKRSAHALEALKSLGSHSPGQRVFIADNGGATYNAKAQRNMWAELLKKLGFRHRDMYNMRHTYATFCLMHNANPAFVALQLGHGLEEFFNTYAKWINGNLNKIQLQIINDAIL